MLGRLEEEGGWNKLSNFNRSWFIYVGMVFRWEVETIIMIKLILSEVFIEYGLAEMLIEVENELNFV